MSGLAKSNDVLSPSQMFVDFLAEIFFSWLATKAFPGLVVLVRGSRTLALLSKDIKHISSESLIN